MSKEEWNLEREGFSFSDKRVYMRKYGGNKNFIIYIEIFPESHFLMYTFLYIFIVIFLNIFTKCKELFKMNNLCTTISLCRNTYERSEIHVYMIYKWSIKCYNIIPGAIFCVTCILQQARCLKDSMKKIWREYIQVFIFQWHTKDAITCIFFIFVKNLIEPIANCAEDIALPGKG